MYILSCSINSALCELELVTGSDDEWIGWIWNNGEWSALQETMEVITLSLALRAGMVGEVTGIVTLVS